METWRGQRGVEGLQHPSKGRLLLIRTYGEGTVLSREGASFSLSEITSGWTEGQVTLGSRHGVALTLVFVRFGDAVASEASAVPYSKDKTCFKGRRQLGGNGWPGTDFQPPALFVLEVPTMDISTLSAGTEFWPLLAHRTNRVIVEEGAGPAGRLSGPVPSPPLLFRRPTVEGRAW